MVVATSTLLIAGLALAAAGTAIQFRAGQKQAKIAKKSLKEQQKAEALERQRARRRTIREARVARGQALNVASAIGAGGGSGIAGGLSGIASQAGANLGFSSQQEGSSRNLTSLSIRSVSAGQLGAIGGGIANIGGALFNAAGSFTPQKKEPLTFATSAGQSGPRF